MLGTLHRAGLPGSQNRKRLTMHVVGIFAFLCFAGANGLVIHPNGQGTPTTVVKSLNGETVMQSGPPITHPEQSRQNENQFVRDPTIFNPKRSRLNSIQTDPTNAMMNNMVRMMNPMAPETIRQEQKPSMSDRSKMMMNMIKNMPNMASVMGDRTAMADLMNAMSSASEIMAKMQNNMKMNQARKSNVQSPYETDYYMPIMTNKMTNMPTMVSNDMMKNAPFMPPASEMMGNMPSMPPAAEMMTNVPSMPSAAEMMTNVPSMPSAAEKMTIISSMPPAAEMMTNMPSMPNMPPAAEMIMQKGQMSDIMSKVSQVPFGIKMMGFSPQQRSKYNYFCL
ncbi:uncharacterized protein LOC133204612 [Saccostrea echinata]|uniref:uncharacterized protein LOC133204612 n=1 Tax=Saccostrea echinata TaxID=191078 RepID=UPI002A7EB61C|nr:uncharacterized protein LOC133204612 [Saccostrea echinata]